MNSRVKEALKNLLTAIDELDKAWTVNNYAPSNQKDTTAMDVAHRLGSVRGCQTILKIEIEFDQEAK